MLSRATSLLGAVLLAWAVVATSAQGEDWQTTNHSPGFCAMHGICGKRKDGDSLNCPANVAAESPSSELAAKLQQVCPTLWSEKGGQKGTYCCTAEQVDKISTDTMKAVPFIVGCPACHHNFLHFWCVLTCSSDQATFANVTEVQQAADNNATVVKAVDYFPSAAFGQAFFDSCKDVKFGAANLPAMSFIGGGAKTFQQWFDFLGTVKDKRFPPIGSPFEITFRAESDLPEGLVALKEDLVGCGNNAFRCSCSDCPAAQGCVQPHPGPHREPKRCHVGRISCLEFALIWAYIGLAALILSGFALGAYLRRRRGTAERQRLIPDPDVPKPGGFIDPLYDDEIQYPLVERGLQALYHKLGHLCGQRPILVILVGMSLVGLCCLGLLRFRVETDPQRLWVGPTSQAAQEKEAYEKSFGPFYRVEQIILSTTPTSASPFTSQASGLPSIVTQQMIELLFDIQDQVDQLTASLQEPGKEPQLVRLTDICYKPFGDMCATQSVLQYWQLNRQLFETEQAKSAYAPLKLTPEYCFSHWYTECRSAFQAPMDPHVVLGGFPGPDTFRNYTSDATSFITTYPVDSSPSKRAAATAWEAAFVVLAKDKLTQLAHGANLTISFSSERSVQDELARESTADALTVALSYLFMLLYIATALGSIPPLHRLHELLLTSRASLGLGGVVIVAASVAGALGLVSAAGVWSTLIIMEVIPFLVLAVGVDNMFVLAHALQKQHLNQPIPDRMAAALAAAGPSITLAAMCEACAFGLAALTPMPAVRNFSLCACVAVLLDFVLQVTVFAALLSLDAERMQQRRADCLPCLRVPKRKRGRSSGQFVNRNYGGYDAASDALLSETAPQLVPSNEAGVDESSCWSLQRVLQTYMERVHAPLIAKPVVQAGVLLLFAATLLLSIAAIPHLSVGLDQSVALPRDSYLQSYYKDIMQQLRVGPPLFLVVNNVNVSHSAPDIARICSVSGCDPQSLLNQVAQAAIDPENTFIAAPAASWIDDFMGWLNPGLTHCCRAHAADGYCPPPDQPPCSGPNATACSDCSTCATSAFEGGRPNEGQFQQYLPWFLSAKPSEGCAKGGVGAYSDALMHASPADPTSVEGLVHGVVRASSFRTYYKPLNEQHEFIEAMSKVRSFVQQIRHDLKLEVYAFSIFHVFFEQYLSVGHDALMMIGLPAGAVFLVCCVLTGSIWSSALMLGVLASLLTHLAGAMLIAGIQVNAVSLVNMAMALGIAVEFCAHIVHSFGIAAGSRVARAKSALESVGASVCSGITLTKLVGVIVLAFARTQIFEVYYFRLYLALVILGALHGLVLLPVLLALMGPPSLAVAAGSANSKQAQRTTGRQ